MFVIEIFKNRLIFRNIEAFNKGFLYCGKLEMAVTARNLFLLAELIVQQILD